MIKGLGCSVPEKIVTNTDLEKIGDTNDQWIRERTGIEQRRVVTTETATDLAFAASVQALSDAGITAEEIDLIIVATISPDMIVPSASCLLRDRLGADSSVAFDVNAACTGFIYATCIAKSLMETSGFNNALVVGVDLNSKLTDWADRGTFILFGDGAGAAVIQKNDKELFLSCNMKNSTDEAKALNCWGSPLENPFRETFGGNQKVAMDGKQVFRFATAAMVDNINNVLEKAGKAIKDVAWFVPHQANKRIIDYAATKLKVPFERFFCNIAEFGNTSSASIPIALTQMQDRDLLKQGDLVLIVAFGGGLTSGAVLFEWGK